MAVTLTSWLAANWKPLVTMAGTALAVSFGAYQDLKGEINDMDREHTAEIAENRASFEQLNSTLGEIRCMLVLEAEDGNPLDCIAIE